MSHPMRAQVEFLESRQMLSATVSDGYDLAPARGKPAANKPAIRLDLVALHEFGHSMGLPHDQTTAVSIMDAYYNANYDPANLYNDVAAQSLRALYASPDSGPWKDSLDAYPGNGVVDVTYSFLYDGTTLDNHKTSTTFATFNGIFGAGKWQKVFVDQLNSWTAASGGKIAFHPYNGTDGFEPAANRTLSAGAPGAAQNDPRFGDIRIGAHAFDGAGKTLAHTYYPPPNGGTYAGDAHFDNDENWVVPAGALGAVTAAAPAAGKSIGAGAAAASLFSGRQIGQQELLA